MPERRDGRQRGTNQVAILLLFVGISACSIPLSAWEEWADVDKSTGLSVRFHDGHQEREIEARIDYSNVVEELSDGGYIRKGQRSTTILGPFTGLDSMDKLEFRSGNLEKTGVFFNGAEVDRGVGMTPSKGTADRVGTNVEIRESLGMGIVDYRVCFSVIEKRLEVWITSVYAGNYLGSMEVQRIYFDRRLRKIVAQINPNYGYQTPFCTDPDARGAGESWGLHLEQLFELGVGCHDEYLGDYGYDLARVEDRYLRDIVERLNRIGKIEDTLPFPWMKIFHFGIGQYEFLEAYSEAYSDDVPVPKQLVFVRRSDSESWYCVVSSTAGDFGVFPDGTGWARRLEVVDGTILRIFSTSDWTGAEGLGEAGSILEFDLSRSKLLPYSGKGWTVGGRPAWSTVDPERLTYESLGGFKFSPTSISGSERR